jgi:hypothetical protein
VQAKYFPYPKKSRTVLLNHYLFRAYIPYFYRNVLLYPDLSFAFGSPAVGHTEVAAPRSAASFSAEISHKLKKVCLGRLHSGTLAVASADFHLNRPAAVR